MGFPHDKVGRELNVRGFNLNENSSEYYEYTHQEAHDSVCYYSVFRDTTATCGRSVEAEHTRLLRRFVFAHTFPLKQQQVAITKNVAGRNTIDLCSALVRTEGSY